VSQARERLRVRCRGAVQGVGFRPFVFRLATDLRLGGWVRNGPDGVVIEVEGAPTDVRAFTERLPAELPPLARLEDVAAEALIATGEAEFRVAETEEGQRRRALVPPDSRLCADCAGEMADPADLRHRYPFTVCTNCGPRFSLVRSLPYDRAETAMACFPLCPECEREYGDPADRRFHTEPVCCPACGPQVWLEDGSGARLAERDQAFALAREELERGAVLAVKGLGGFQLACRADDEAAVLRLRQRKRRPTKPLAVMARDLEAARRLVRLEPADEALLLGPRAPILLAQRRPEADISVAVAPGVGDLGVMLPTTPLHLELLHGLEVPALVMTSGNASDEPICRGNREALLRLAGLADLFLLHDRDILRRVDDSVARTSADGPVLVRRSRGWVPEPLPLPLPAPQPVLAMGGHLKVTGCFALEDQAFLSPHVGDLDCAEARSFHLEVLDGLEDFLQAAPEMVVIDPHPDYPGARLGEQLARSKAAGLLKVQHHLAHVVAAAAEHGRFPGPAESMGGVALDGTGWGPDGTAWGGELLEWDGMLRWRRAGHLECLPLVGGERAVTEPWRVAAAALVRAGMSDELPRLPLALEVGEEELETVRELAEQPLWPLSSGAGRLFEAAGALFGLCARNGYEGEAALRFEALAALDGEELQPWPELGLEESGDRFVLPSAALLAAAARRLLRGEPAARVAAGFHDGFCRMVARLAHRGLSPEVRVVAVGGGCMVNRLLRGCLRRRLESFGYEVLMATEVPPGDGGLAFGQAAVAAAALTRGAEPRITRSGSCA